MSEVRGTPAEGEPVDTVAWAEVQDPRVQGFETQDLGRGVLGRDGYYRAQGNLWDHARKNRRERLRPLYIFDLDGTLALIEHRLHFVKNKPKDWNAFYEACHDDVPNPPVVEAFRAIRKSYDVWIWSGRSDQVRDKTVAWLHKHDLFNGFWNPYREDKLRMRPAGNNVPDDQLKRSWYDDMNVVDRSRLLGTFDDRDRMVKMWRSVGVTCFQVAEGDF